MQTQFKEFLRACLQQEELSKRSKAAEAPIAENPKDKNKIFSFGVLEGEVEEQKEGEEADNKQDPKSDKKDKDKEKHDANKQAPEEPKPEEEVKEEEEEEVSGKFSEMPTDRFVSSVLFAMTNTTPRIQNALVFRRSMDEFTKINEARERELAQVSGETSKAVRSKSEELAIDFLDKAVQDNVLPYIQTDALTGTIVGTEMKDAFDPPLEPNIYARSDRISPLDVAMVQACEGMLEKTEPLFMAIHRLPPGGEMYTGLVEVMMVVMQTFNAAVQRAMTAICEDTSAEEVLEGLGPDKGKLTAALGKREAFIMLLKAYEYDLDLIDEVDVRAGARAIAASGEAGDEKESPSKSVAQGNDGLPPRGIEREEAILKLEMEQLEDYLDFFPYHQDSLEYDLIPKAELKRATCLAHRYECFTLSIGVSLACKSH